MSKTRSFALFLSVLVMPVASQAEEPEVKSGAYGSLGLGVGGEGAAALASLGFRQGSRLISVRVATTREINIFDTALEASRSDLSVLYGRMHSGRFGFISGGAGLGLVHGVRRGRLLSTEPGWFGRSDYERLTHTTVGLAFSAKTGIGFRYGGLGLEGFGNVNSKASFVAVALTLDGGRLR
jgi:hypothetical protein